MPSRGSFAINNEKDDEITQAIWRARRENRDWFIQLLRRYDGGKASFSSIIAEAANYGMSQSVLARELESTTASICRWAHGGAPARLLRRVVVQKICEYLQDLQSQDDQRIEELSNNGSVANDGRSQVIHSTAVP